MTQVSYNNICMYIHTHAQVKLNEDPKIRRGTNFQLKFSENNAKEKNPKF